MGACGDEHPGWAGGQLGWQSLISRLVGTGRCRDRRGYELLGSCGAKDANAALNHQLGKAL